MEFVEQVSALFGYSSDTKELSDFLDKQHIRERPKFDPAEGAPEAIVSKDDEGYYLLFGKRSGFERRIGPSVGDSSLGYFVLEEIRLQGVHNFDGASPFKEKLPFGLNFSQTIDEVIGVLGKPDFDGGAGEPQRVMIWNNFKNLEIGTVLSSDEKYLCYLSLAPVRKKNRG